MNTKLSTYNWLNHKCYLMGLSICHDYQLTTLKRKKLKKNVHGSLKDSFVNKRTRNIMRLP